MADIGGTLRAKTLPNSEIFSLLPSALQEDYPSKFQLIMVNRFRENGEQTNTHRLTDILLL